MRVIKGALIFCLVLLIPIGLLVAYSHSLDIKADRFYDSRPILQAMRQASRTQAITFPSAAEKSLTKTLPAGTDAPTAVTSLSAEGFHCQRKASSVPSGDVKKMLDRADEMRRKLGVPKDAPQGAISCQLLAPSNIGSTDWIVDLQIDELGRLGGAKVRALGIFF